VLGTIKKAKPTAMRNRRCGEGLESATCEYAKSDAARRPAPPADTAEGTPARTTDAKSSAKAGRNTTLQLS